MSRTHKDTPNSKQNRPKRSRKRAISVRAVRRDPPDLRKLSRALITLALAEAQQQQAETTDSTTTATTQTGRVPSETEADRSPGA